MASLGCFSTPLPPEADCYGKMNKKESLKESLTRSSQKSPFTAPQVDRGEGARRAFGWKRENLSLGLWDAQGRPYCSHSTGG